MTGNTQDTHRLRTDDMHVVCPRAAGVDVHKTRITAALRVCEAGGGPARVMTQEFSALPDGLRAMTDWLLDHDVTAAALESTGVYWKAPFEALEDAGIRADLHHAEHVRQIRGRKTDGSDSLWLARVCQFGLVTPSFVPPRRFRQLRQLTRYRRTLVAERSRARNRIHKILDHDGLRLGGVLSDIFGMNGRRILDGLAAGRPARRILADVTGHIRGKLELLTRTLAATLDPVALVTLQMQLEAVDRTAAAVAALDGRIQAALADYRRPLLLLQTIPGIDLRSAAAILVEIGPDVAAFRSARHLAAWAGVAPGNHVSARKRRSGRVRPGNRMLRATLAECAHGAARSTSSQFHRYHHDLAKRLGYKRAIVATAHKLLRVIHAVLTNDRPYSDPRIDYERLVIESGAPRWIRVLKQDDLIEEVRSMRT
ncbi:MAG: IS110 family transposase [Acidobacteria bacterium]|nr:IS110 family transposase [Acidobacteriota bacterium]